MIVIDYDVTNRALAAMCEVASETCSVWFNHQDTNWNSMAIENHHTTFLHHLNKLL